MFPRAVGGDLVGRFEQLGVDAVPLDQPAGAIPAGYSHEANNVLQVHPHSDRGE